MNKRLIVQLIMHPDCRLIAIDSSDYNSIGIDIEEHVMIDFLVYNEEKEPVKNTLKVRYNKLNRGYYRSQFTTEYILPKDGTYTYYKMVIPILDHFAVGADLYKNIQDQLFYYDNNIYFFGNDLYQESYTLKEVLDNSYVVEDCLEWYKKVHENHASQTFYLPRKKLFSVCKLNKCLAHFQKKMLDAFSCNDLLCDKNVSRNQRDFLFSAMYVFDYLKDVGNFKEAQRILDNISECNFMCSDDSIKSDCNCGNSL